MLDLKIVCEDEKYLPTYANDTDACMDLKIKVDEQVVLTPHTTMVFETGIQVSVPEDYVMLIYPRSSTGFKLNCMLANTTAVIDTGFKDTIKLAIHNFGNDKVVLKDGQRVAQFMVIPRPKINLIQVQDDDEFRQGDRGGGIGSSGV